MDKDDYQDETMLEGHPEGGGNLGKHVEQSQGFLLRELDVETSFAFPGSDYKQWTVDWTASQRVQKRKFNMNDRDEMDNPSRRNRHGSKCPRTSSEQVDSAECWPPASPSFRSDTSAPPSPFPVSPLTERFEITESPRLAAWSYSQMYQDERPSPRSRSPVSIVFQAESHFSTSIASDNRIEEIMDDFVAYRSRSPSEHSYALQSRRQYTKSASGELEYYLQDQQHTDYFNLLMNSENFETRRIRNLPWFKFNGMLESGEHCRGSRRSILRRKLTQDTLRFSK
jgi:hypothetical protein